MGRSRGSWGEQEGQRRVEREGRRERRRDLWAWRERVGVTRVTSEWEGEERREEERGEVGGGSHGKHCARHALVING